MDADEEGAEMGLLREQSLGEYKALLQLMSDRHLAAFRSLVTRGLRRHPPSLDLNRLLPHPVSMRLLDKAASEGLADFVEFLLEVGAEPNRANPERKRAPVHFAAEAGRAEALAALLRHPGVNPNLLVSQMTALHYAVNANCEPCARLLLEAGASPNIPNSKGITALHLAAERNARGMVRLILDTSRLIDLDTYRDRRKRTARALIEEKFPDMRLPDESERPDAATLLRYYLTANDEASFATTLVEAEDLGGPERLAELLRLAVERGLERATADLLGRAGAAPASLPELARLAIQRAHPGVLELLLSRGPRMAGRLLLPAAQELGVPGSAADRLRCLELVLAQPEVDVRQEDDKNNSALHYAARAECREAVELLLRRGSYLGHMNGFGQPPLAHIAPELLEAHLDSCLGSSNERTEEYEIVMDYANLVPHNTECGASDDYWDQRRRRSSRRHGNPGSETEALLYIAENKGLRHLLKHPILASFLYLKYLRIRHVLYVNFLLYLLFYCVLVVYIWVITGEAPEPEDGTRTNSSAGRRGAQEPSGLGANWRAHPALSALMALSLLYLVARESLQAASAPLSYALGPENWLEAGLIALTLWLLLGGGREVGALGVLLATWELVLLMAQHPRMSTDIEMFKTVTVNFAKFLFLYVFLIVAFAFAFFVLFQGDDNFPNPLGSLFKTVVMLAGEFDSGELPFAAYPLLSRAVFCGFIFLIVIILLNLLNGLAVNDTAEILAEAELVCLVSRARLVAYAERMVVGGPAARGPGCLGGGAAPSRLGPLRFVARRILLFPRYLPRARLSVKPLKSHEITLHGRARRGGRCSGLAMDPLVAQRAKQVLQQRGRQSTEERVLERLEGLEARFDGLEAALGRLARALVAAKEPLEPLEPREPFA